MNRVEYATLTNDPDIFDKHRLPSGLDELVRSMNPWWRGQPGRVLPTFRRWAFPRVLRGLLNGLAPITVVRGPRQVGKSTIQDQIIKHLLEDGVPASRILKVQFDDIKELGRLPLPVQSIAWWYENRILGQTFNQAAHAGNPAFLLLDEVQNVDDWTTQLKNLVDTNTVRVLVTGSSALRIEAGRDSLAGRISTVELGPLLLREIASLRLGIDVAPLLADNGIEALATKDAWKALRALGESNRDIRNTAFSFWSARGGYPRAHERSDVAWPEIADDLVETVVNRAIQHDLRQGERGRKRDEALLREVFRIACRYTGQTPGVSVFVSDIVSSLHSNIGAQRVNSYLRFLEGALLVRLIPPLELRLKRRRGPSKLCVCDHALRAAWLHEVIPLDPAGLSASPHLADLAGHIAEGAAGYFLSGVSHLDVSHSPERDTAPEVDYVLTIGERRIPIEIKYRNRIDSHADTRGLRAFIEKTVNNAPFGVLVTLHDHTPIDDPRIIQLPLSSLMLLR